MIPVLHLIVYYDGNKRRDEEWRGPRFSGDPDPLMLKSLDLMLFALDRVDGDEAHYLPRATHADLDEYRHLRRWGFHRVVAPPEHISEDSRTW